MTEMVYKRPDGEGEEILSELLQRIKLENDLTWIEMDEICGHSRMYAYACKTSDGKPNHPRGEDLHKIVDALGLDIKDFVRISAVGERRDSPLKKGSEEYREALKKLGDGIVLLNTDVVPEEGKKTQLLSSTSIRTILGETFYAIHGNTFSKRKELLNELHELDPEYKSIELQHQIQHRNNPKKLRKLPDGNSEEDIIIQAIFDFPDGLKTGKNLPKGLYEYVFNALNEQLAKYGLGRSKQSADYHTKKIIEGEIKKEYTLRRGSPVPNGSLRDKIQLILSEAPTDTSIMEETMGEVKNTYIHYGPPYHQTLLLYLLDPVNIERNFGEARLVGISIKEKDVDEKLKDLYTDKIKSHSIPDDNLAGFADSWLFCDIVFQRQNGQYLVVTVKERAVDTELFKNATLARQHLASSVALVEDNIGMSNWRSMETDYSNVDGILAAYEIEPDLRSYLEFRQGRDAREFPFRDVQSYLKRADRL
jgi:hypothetical protein